MEVCFRGLTPNRVTLDAIYQVRKEFPDVTVGCGTTPTAELAQDAINSGALFVVSALTDERIIRVAHRNGILVIPGTRDETQAGVAKELGCLIAKVLPPFGETAVRVQFFKAFFDHVPKMLFTPSTGITPEVVGEFLHAGAPFVATAQIRLIPPAVVAEKNWGQITANARTYIAAVEKARAQ